MSCNISVIVPIYNAEQFLHRCVDSILSQTYANFELLLINDGSTDNSGIICDEYAAMDGRVQVFHKENGGASSARNLGLSKAQGCWIAFVDCDDYVLSNFLATYVELILKKDVVELCILGIKPDYSLSSEYIINRTSIEYYGNVKNVVLLMNSCQMFGSLCNKLFKLSVIKENDLLVDETFKYREDEEFLLRYMSHISWVATTSEQCYVYLVPRLDKYQAIYNLNVQISMNKSICYIYQNKANQVTDLYQVELFYEWLRLLRIDFFKSMKIFPSLIKIIGWRIFRVVPMKYICKKMCKYMVK